MNYKDIFDEIEKKWVKKWDKENPAFCNLDSDKPKFYSLGMFVYPSGHGLHAGHPKNYFPLDCISRYKKMKGFEVLNPMGFDAFGLPAEQHARKTNQNPRITVYESSKKFKDQFKRLGMFFDWSKEINTSDPNYFKITQWCFLRLYKTKYAKRQKETVLWCEKLGTVLAKEETKYINGQLVSEIGEFNVVQRKEYQWVMDLKRDANMLLSSFEKKGLLNWPKDIIQQQKNWIGRLVLTKRQITNGFLKTEVLAFTKKTHFKKAILYVSKNSEIFKKYVKKAKIMSESYSSKIEGKITLKIPYLHLDIKIDGFLTKTKIIFVNRVNVFNEIEQLLLDDLFISDPINLFLLQGRDYDYLYPKLVEHANKFTLDKNDWETFRLRNWVFSRQRYWGEPIPIVFDKQGKDYPIDVKDLPIILPKVESYIPQNGKLTVLESQEEWCKVIINNKEYRREVFTMPQWAGSSWYYLAYLLKDGNNYLGITSEKAKKRFEKWLPVDLYIGGCEHAVLHLIYSRFWHHILYHNYGSTKLLKSILTKPEPFFKLVNHGMVLDENGKKMSKSKGNVVDPLKIVDEYGADAYRLFLLFSVPIKEQTKLNYHDIGVMQDWLARVWRLLHNIKDNIKNKEIEKEYHLLVKKTTELIEELKLNVAISSMMVFVNKCHLLCGGSIPREFVKGFLQILHCFAPFISQELYHQFVAKEAIVKSSWPIYDAKVFAITTNKIVIQINGKFRDILEFSGDLTQETITNKILARKKVRKFLLNNKKIIKIVYIKNKVINLVVK